LAVRTIYLLRHDIETRRRLGVEVMARRERAEEALDALCSRLFGRDVAVQDLLREGPIGRSGTLEPVP
jgi:hypothetical protein